MLFESFGRVGNEGTVLVSQLAQIVRWFSYLELGAGRFLLHFSVADFILNVGLEKTVIPFSLSLWVSVWLRVAVLVGMGCTNGAEMLAEGHSGGGVSLLFTSVFWLDEVFHLCALLGINSGLVHLLDFEAISLFAGDSGFFLCLSLLLLGFGVDHVLEYLVPECGRDYLNLPR